MPRQTTTPNVAGLRAGTLGVPSVTLFTISASGPLIVIAGGIPAAFAVTGVTALAVTFVVVGIPLWLISDGYAALSQHIRRGAFYAYLARGLGRAAGIAAGFVSLVAYSAIQLCLYGLFGAVATGASAMLGGPAWPWWAWALGIWAVIAVLGLRRIDLTRRTLAVFLGCELVIVAAIIAVSFANPAEPGAAVAAFNPGAVAAAGAGFSVALAFAVAATVGWESASAYAEETRSADTVARATRFTVLFICGLYAAGAVALVTAYGPSGVIEAARDPQAAMPIGLLAGHLGDTAATIAVMFLLTSTAAAMLSFHGTIARYIFSLGRERTLPGWLARTGPRTGAPIVGSAIQSTTGLITIVGFAAAGADPVATLFTWGSFVGALGLTVLLCGLSLAVIGFFSAHRDVSPWRRLVQPTLAGVAFSVITGFMVVFSGDLLGEQSAAVPWILIGLIPAAALIGLVRAALMWRAGTPAWRQVGYGGSTPVRLEHTHAATGSTSDAAIPAGFTASFRARHGRPTGRFHDLDV